jgi:hypothetical protein
VIRVKDEHDFWDMIGHTWWLCGLGPGSYHVMIRGITSASDSADVTAQMLIIDYKK